MFFGGNGGKPAAPKQTPQEIAEQKKKEAEEKMLREREALTDLEVPGNIPAPMIYFGSQTGTAEKFATQLQEEADMLLLKPNLVDFNDFSEEDFPKHKFVIVIIATHYEGDPCDNTKKFFKWIKAHVKKQTKTFEGMKFCVFGLGDTSYELFNEMGKNMDEWFEKLGGERLKEMKAANAETFTTEEDFNNWKSDLWQTICDYYKPTDTSTPQ